MEDSSLLQVIDIETPQSQRSSSNSNPSLSFDPEWLAITRAFQPWFSVIQQQPPFPEEAEARALVAREREWVSKNVKTNDDGEIPVSSYQTFAMTAPGPGTESSNKLKQRKSSELTPEEYFDLPSPICLISLI